jgi:hypothetical protein
VKGGAAQTMGRGLFPPSPPPLPLLRASGRGYTGEPGPWTQCPRNRVFATNNLLNSRRRPRSKGEGARMRLLLSDFVLFSCLTAFVAGLVIAAATLLI